MNYDRLERIKKLSPEKQALLFDALKDDALEIEGSRIVHQSRQETPIPLSFAQRRLWLLEQLKPGSRAYNEFSAIEILGSLNIQVLEQSLNEIVYRHEILRTIFPTLNGEPVQVITPTKCANLSVMDLSNLPKSKQDVELQRIADKESHYSFDLSHGPLHRLTLIRLNDEESILLIGAHHIILDGWSVDIFRRELIELYKAFIAGEPSPLPELPIQYSDFAIWQRQMLQKEVLEAHLNYWMQQLSNLPPLLQIPVANHHPEFETFRGARHYFKLGATLTRNLKALSRQENVTLFMTLLSSFQILLHRYTNQSDLPIGTTVANRNQPEVENLIGFFVNMLVLRGDLKGNPSVRQLLQRVKRIAIEAYDHSGLPFDYLVEALQPERSASYSPLFQVVFNLQNTPKQMVELPQLTLNTIELGSVTAKFDLTLSMEETSEGLQGYWQYNTDLFDTSTIKRMNDHLQVLMTEMVANPDKPIMTLPILTAKERKQIMVDWNQTDVWSPREQCIHNLFEVQVEKSPDSIAVVYENKTISYRELNSSANHVAHRLLALGVTSNTLVGICMDRSIEMIVSILGVLKAGAAYVPIDPSYPRERLAFIMKDANIVTILTQQKLLEVLPITNEQLIILDSEITEEDTAAPITNVTPDNLAYVIYTSGSTGTPKGVLVSHANLVHTTTARWEYYKKPVTNFLLLPSFAFDSSIAVIFWTLTQGGALILPTSTSSVDVFELCEIISLRQVSHLLAIPSLYLEILREAQEEQLVSLKTVIVAGEPCPARVINAHHKHISQTSLFNEYGPTEGTVWSTVYKCESQSALTSVPIGRPIANTQIYLLDSYLNPVPIGVVGEIYIGGDGVTAGYLNDSKLTGKQFISTSFTTKRLYKTGDLARYQPDGNLEFLGRVDQQVKIRGFRVELGEVEMFLLQFPSVREAAVTVREDVEKQQRLVGYVSVNPKTQFSIEALKRFMTEKLPSYALPSEIEVLGRLPRLPNGKIDRTSLCIQQARHPEDSAPSVDEWTELEVSIAKIWKDILNIEIIKRHDNFFSIGGTSLSAIRVYNSLRQITNKPMAITDIFKHPTISSLAQFITSNKSPRQ